MSGLHSYVHEAIASLLKLTKLYVEIFLYLIFGGNSENIDPPVKPPAIWYVLFIQEEDLVPAKWAAIETLEKQECSFKSET